MATDSRELAEPTPDEDDSGASMKDWYDRSSLKGDFMVMIADQTEEEYLRRCPESKFCEFIDGTVYLPSPVTIWHQFERQFLAFLLEAFTSRQGAGIVLIGPAALKLRADCFLEPDLFVVPPGGEAQFQEVYCDPPVLLIVEVLSKSTRSHDLNHKAELYRQAGVIEVWFVDDREDVLIVHRRTEEEYEVERIESGPYHSRALPGFWLDVSWLWARPQPDVLTCLDTILAGPPA
jgi:Uma2 family endonuclease